MQKYQFFPFFNILTGYEVETYTGDAPWLVTLIGEVINLIMGLSLKTVSGP